MLVPICTESCANWEVKHWITAPDIEALAVATAALDEIMIGCAPVISVTF